LELPLSFGRVEATSCRKQKGQQMLAFFRYRFAFFFIGSGFSRTTIGAT
jgi:hypothetical protein